MKRPTPAPGPASSGQRPEQAQRNQEAIDLLNAWEQEDAGEQRETWAILKRSLETDPITVRRVV